ncbi:MAG: SUMF1/EgtB/PvdO family nonheme iron enzyme [Planctomycetes bacterium]|nr:SUMF1/EgtB/PvdO family nonheme iron enzyme [Planctomycetota bacterium]
MDSTASFPPDLEQELAALLERDATTLRAGIDRLAERHPGHAAALQRLASVWGGVPAAGSAVLAQEIGPGDQLGPWRIDDRIGSGGMGTVFLATHASLGNKAAVKVVKPGMDTAAVLRRFAAEQRTLARLQHPHIARVHDAGATPAGRPYFVMEYVPGRPIHRHCAEHRLDTDTRIRLVLQICAGLQHAHQRGVVHRDLTCNNVLITRVDDRPLAKIIDFGLAMVGDRDEGEQTCFSAGGALIGTPEYMAPEQIGFGVPDIDIRADVYAVGVVLFELLTGRLPFPSEQLRRDGFAGLLHTLREQPPPRPSAVLTADAPTPAARLRRDLDWIVLRCLEKDRNRRYASIGELAADLERSLAGLPVDARPPSLGYLLVTSVRRHRLAVFASLSVLASLLIGLVVSLRFWSRAEQRADVIAAQKQEITTRVEQFELLAAAIRLEELRRSHPTLPAAAPTTIAPLRTWLLNARPLQAMAPRLQAALAAIRPRALPIDASTTQADAASHPRRGELTTAEQTLVEVARLRGLQPPQSPIAAANLPSDLANASVADLQKFAWARVQPDAGSFDPAAVAEGLAAAERCLQQAGDDALVRGRAELTLGWARVRCGQPGAVDLLRAACERVPRERSYFFLEHERRLLDLLHLVTDSAAAEALAERTARLREQVRERRTWRFPADADQFLHDSVARLLTELDGLSTLIEDIDDRLAWAERMVAESIEQHSARWRDLGVPPQPGLVPIGRNPASGLLEFYDLRSAADPQRIPAHGPRGELTVDGDTGIVFVLLAGGESPIGAVATDDPDAQPDESPVHRVELAPFLLARHELTQGQWLRLTRGPNPALFPAGRGYRGSHGLTTLAAPVENVSHEDCVNMLRRHGLLLPTEVQWEYAARGGRQGPFGGLRREDLATHANVLDRVGTTFTPQAGPGETWDDGHAGPAPVGAFPANPFGLHDLLGNVWEWTADGNHGYDTACRQGDGLRGDPARSPDRVLRGGSWGDRASVARVTRRTRAHPLFKSNSAGLRAARIWVP